jgi:hypothetical protein
MFDERESRNLRTREIDGWQSNGGVRPSTADEFHVGRTFIDSRRARQTGETGRFLVLNSDTRNAAAPTPFNSEA